MKRKVLTGLIVLVFVLGSTISVVLAAAKYSNWIPANNFPNIYKQIVNRSGGNEPEAVRFANQNQHRVKIHVVFVYRPNNANVGDRTVYLEGGNSYSEWIELGPNVTYSFSVNKL